MLKAFMLFLLVISLVNSALRLRAVLLAAAVGVLAMTALAVLEFHGFVHLTGLASVEQRSFDPMDSSPVIRLCGTGVFNDPNDLALILVFAMIACIYGLGERRMGSARALLLGPLALFGYALVLTHSRGGLLSAGGALMAFLTVRLGWRNMLPIGLCLLAAFILLPSWGRETTVDFDSPEDTFQTRLDLWSDSLDCFRSAPIFGIGQGKLADTIGAVTHNSFLHAFAEMGVLGGGVFIGAFYGAMRALWRSSSPDFQVARLRPYMFAIAVGYAAGLLSLSRCYTVPTQLVLALVMAYLGLARIGDGPALPRLNGAWVRAIGCVSVVFLIATYVFVRVMLQPGHS
jgi:O-antigen ligase